MHVEEELEYHRDPAHGRVLLLHRRTLLYALDREVDLIMAICADSPDSRMVVLLVDERLEEVTHFRRPD